MVIGIYKIHNTVSGHFYVGSSLDIHKRWCQHKTDLRSARHHSTHLQRAWVKYGEPAFELVILEECPPSIRKEREQHYLDTLTPWDHTIGYNSARTTTNYNPSEATRQKMSLASKARRRNPLSEETKQRVSQALVGKIVSKETRQKMSQARLGKTAHNKGVVYSTEVRQSMSKAQTGKKGHPLSDEQKEQLRTRVISEETRERMSQAAKERERLKKEKPIPTPTVRVGR